jgi:hypothetical protein
MIERTTDTTTGVPILKIFLGWFAGALVLAVPVVLLWQPMAGLLSIIVLFTCFLTVGAPIIHVALCKLFFSGSNQYWWLIAAIVLFSTLAAFVVIVAGNPFHLGT